MKYELSDDIIKMIIGVDGLTDLALKQYGEKAWQGVTLIKSALSKPVLDGKNLEAVK